MTQAGPRVRGARLPDDVRRELIAFARERRRDGVNERATVLGRKNWLFVGSDDAAEVNTIFVSLLASCAMEGVEPCAYLRDLLCLLLLWHKSRELELAPVNWQQPLEQQDTQQRLDANPFRTAIVALDRDHSDDE